ncbi:hypothetical protein GCM10009111_10960 [Colwellia asteriadis]|uniref:Uncharacterized protein n=1 Tax=Colwellia asteriadis TaxID=517723 RepID=A0ABP3WEJ4_9GAMM
MNNKTKSILCKEDPVFKTLAPNGSFLRGCLNVSKWDDMNANTNSLAHYNLRLSISKTLQVIDTNEDVSSPLIYLLTSSPQFLTAKDVIHGFKSMELLLIRHYSEKQAEAYCRGARTFFKDFSEPYQSNVIIQKAYSPSLISNLAIYQPNQEVDLFEIQVNRSFQRVFVDPDYFPGLFIEDSLLVDILTNLESTSKDFPKEYSTIASFRSLLNELKELPSDNPVISLLNSKTSNITPELLLEALYSLEKALHTVNSNRKLHQVSILFRSLLFSDVLKTPSLLAIKNSFQTNFNTKGKLKFKPTYSINIDGRPFKIDSFKIPSLALTGGVVDYCLSKLELESKKNSSKNTGKHSHIISQTPLLFEFLHKINCNDFANAHLMLSKVVGSLTAPQIKLGLKDIEFIIIEHFPEQSCELLELFKQFLGLCDIPTKNGKLITEINIESLIESNEAIETMSFKIYRKHNGRKRQSDYLLNISKIESLITPNGILQKSLLNLQNKGLENALVSTTLSNLDQTLTYIVNSNIKSPLLKNVLKSPIEALTQRDFRLAFVELENIIDAIGIQVKSAKSQAIRTFLNKYAGKINNKIEIKNCGFNSKFNASKERSAPKLLEPVDENGEPLVSPIQKQHLSSTELRKEIKNYIEQPIEQILKAANQEISLYKKLLGSFDKYTNKDELGQYEFHIADEITQLVLDDQQGYSHHKINLRSKALIEKYSAELVCASYLRHQTKQGVSEQVCCTNKDELIPDFVEHWYGKTSSGMRDFFYSGLLLPRNILLVCFIRLVIRTTWNKDVITQLTRKDLPDSLPDGEFVLCGFKDKVDKPTFEIKIEPHEKEIRDVVALLIQHHENMVILGLSPKTVWETPSSTSLNFLSSDTVNKFCNHYTLPKFTMELLAKHQINLRKGIDGSLINSQRERNHASSSVTSSYLSHPIALLEYEAKNADFQRRLETTVQFRHKESKIEKYNLNRNNVDETLIISPNDSSKEDFPDWYLLPDGSSCMDIFSPVDRSKRDSVCKGRKCHSGEGCEFNRVQLGKSEFILTLRQQSFFISRGESLLDKHGREYFDEYIAPNMRFTFGLAKYVELVNPVLFKEAKGEIQDEN